LYAKGWNTSDALEVFNKMSEPNFVSWTTMIAGFSLNGLGDEALQLLFQMHQAIINPNEFTFGSALGECSTQVVAIENGKQVHAYIFKFGYESIVCVASGLVTMYAKVRCRVFL